MARTSLYPPDVHIDMMEHPERWPAWPRLPVKNYQQAEPDGWPALGFLLDSHGPVVYLGLMFQAGDYVTLSTRTYASYAAIVADGWEVD